MAFQFLQLARAQAALRAALAEGPLPLEAEVELRVALSEGLKQAYDMFQIPEYLYDSIEHDEAILRRLPKNSPERPTHLNSLSYSRMSEFAVDKSRRAVDEAVRCGKLAREEAIATGIRETNPALYCKILNNAGYALSHRSQMDDNATPDLNEAINFARELKEFALPGSKYYKMTVTNLITRLRLRNSAEKNSADLDEAMQLLNEQMSQSPPGSMPHALALLQLGQMAADKFEQTGVLDDIDEAVRQLSAGIAALPTGYEKVVECYEQISMLHHRRFEKTKDIVDAKNAAECAAKALTRVPASHGVSGKYIMLYMQYLRDYAKLSTSVADVDEAIKLGNLRLSEMPDQYPQRHNTRWAFTDVLGAKYILTRSLESLTEALNFTTVLCREFNELIAKAGTRGPVNTTLVYGISTIVKRLSSAQPGKMKTAASDKIYEYISTNFQTKDFVNAVLDTQREHEEQLVVYVDAVEAGKYLSENEIDEKVAEQRRQQLAALAAPRTESTWQRERYKTEFGLRNLAVDPRNKKIIFDMNGLIQNILGSDPTEALPLPEFQAREERMEKEAYEDALAKGKHPNPSLCRMCRHVKPLERISWTNKGYTWSTGGDFVPFGNWAQLNCRSSCSVCRLVRSLVASEHYDTIHPMLDLLDPEIAGTSIERVKMANGEVALQVEYGMRHVGELRIVTPANAGQALRQAHEVDDTAHITRLLEEKKGPLHSADGQQVNFRQLRKWLANCDSNHGSVCNGYRGTGSRYDADISIILIDVQDKCLVPATTAAKYFALSYVWGGAQLTQTLLSNYPDRCLKGGLSGELPKTIADAMMLASSLGERYLWVDALCIKQDDVEQKKHDIDRMDIIYSKAFATIVAMHGNSAEAGLPGVQKGSRKPQQIETVEITGRSKDLAYKPGSSRNNAVHLVATPPPLHLTLDGSPWDTRGWILQERLLSRRCIYFTSRYVYFQCGQDIVSECGTHEQSQKHRTLQDKTTDAESPSALDNPVADLRRVVDLEPAEQKATVFAAYAKLVKTYSKRQLSYPTDVLNALSGMLAVLKQYFEGDTFSGLPAMALDLALLWAPADRLHRRGTSPPTSFFQSTGTTDRDFPSWSWAGWTGPVEYRFLTSPEEPLPKRLTGSYTIIVDGQRLTIADKSTSALNDSKAPATNVALPEIVDNPTLPNVLQFVAPCVPLTAFAFAAREPLSDEDHIHVGSSQSVRSILDPGGHRCGLWWDQLGYSDIEGAEATDAKRSITLVAINQHDDTFARRPGPHRVEGEIELFDGSVYAGVGPRSGLVNILAIETDTEHDYAERITVARIHADAWEAAGPKLATVRLA